MASKKILLLLDTDRYAYPLIDFLSGVPKSLKWTIKVGLTQDGQAGERLAAEFKDLFERADMRKTKDLELAIRKHDLVIAIVSDSFLLHVADSCISHRKTLISPARLTRQMALKKSAAKENDTLLLMDCGLSPGLDHIVARKAIDNIHSKGGTITSFHTLCGVVPFNSQGGNPWHFKPDESMGEVPGWGKQTNRYLIEGRIQHIPWFRMFERAQRARIPDFEDLEFFPEGDSLYYRKIYNLTAARTVIKGKLLRAGVPRLFDLLMKLGLTDAGLKVDMPGEVSAREFVDSLVPESPEPLEDRVRAYTGASIEEIEKLRWLGLFDPSLKLGNLQDISPASVLQLLMEEKLKMDAGDTDTVIMEQRFSYEFRDENQELTATLALAGENERRTALAKVIGYTCGAAAKSVLLGSIKSKGLHIPIVREIYDPILNELEELGIAFRISDRKLQFTT